MPNVTAKKTLVKSPPELWTELSEVEGLARHLGEFGDIRITKLKPETMVAWEGERASGTVDIEVSGWGTKVTITADLTELHEEVAPASVRPAAPATPRPPAPVPARRPEPPTARKRLSRSGFLARLFGQGSRPAAPSPVWQPPPPDPPAAPVAATVPADPALDSKQALAVLEGALVELGSAHHRPFSRE